MLKIEQEKLKIEQEESRLKRETEIAKAEAEERVYDDYISSVQSPVSHARAVASVRQGGEVSPKFWTGSTIFWWIFEKGRIICFISLLPFRMKKCFFL